MSSIHQNIDTLIDRPPCPGCERIPELKAAVTVLKDILTKLQNIVKQIEIGQTL
jgi:hypothetical protein